jgi:uncharacterized integral membrane protein (TIGR00698 family)
LTSSAVSSLSTQWRQFVPGLVLCATVGLAAQFLSQEYGAPVMLMALLLGSAFNFLGEDQRFRPGLLLCARKLLRLAVGLLGLQVSLTQVSSLGVLSGAFIIAAVLCTIAFGIIFAIMLRQGTAFGLLSGGAVAICGASAAMAIASAMPAGKIRDKELLLTIVAVTSLSTLAMILYPVVCRALDLDAAYAGFFLGATIHDVAQVVGAGYSHSESAGEIAVFTKMLRVALLLPIVIGLGIVGRRRARSQGRPDFPVFLLGFALLFAINSAVIVPAPVIEAAAVVSRACLVLAITALGVQTSLQQMASCGWRPMLLVLLETLFLLFMTLLFVVYLLPAGISAPGVTA